MSKPAPEPHVAPAALYAPAEDPCRPYIPGPVLAYSADRGVVLFAEEPALFGGYEAWPESSPRRRAGRWALWLQAALIFAALVWAGAVPPGAAQ